MWTFQPILFSFVSGEYMILDQQLWVAFQLMFFYYRNGEFVHVLNWFLASSLTDLCNDSFVKQQIKLKI
jgi:hypothetical protein